MFANLRDLGGLPLKGGGSTRHGVLLRSDAPTAGLPEPTDVTWPPRTVIDLRTPRESRAHPAHWPRGVRSVNHPLLLGTDAERRALGADLAGFYRHLVTEAADRLAAVPMLVDPSGPTLLHCAAGKDRTGMAAAVLLSAAGVARDAILDDYLRTEESLGTVLRRLTDTGADDAPGVHGGWTVDPEGFDAALALVESHAGGARGWLVAHDADPVALARLVARIRRS